MLHDELYLDEWTANVSAVILQVTRISFPPPGVHAMPTPVTTMTFDTFQELLWTGNDYVGAAKASLAYICYGADSKTQGRVTSFLGSELQRYTSFKAQLSTDGAVRQILVNEKGVIVLGSKDVHMAQRRGPPIWHIK
jgi:PAB-dependent poly(A)-specific ribonuclease subunit 2